MARPSGFREADVLTKAMLVFWRHGYNGTSVRHLERATGLTASSLYNRFGSKDALFAGVLDHYIERVVRRRIRCYLSHPDSLEGLRGFFESSYAYISDERPPMACLLSNTALEKAAADPAVRARLNRGFSLIEQAFDDSLRRAVAAGQLRADTDTCRWARHLLLCLHGVLIASTVRPEHARLSQLVDDAMTALPRGRDLEHEREE